MITASVQNREESLQPDVEWPACDDTFFLKHKQRDPLLHKRKIYGPEHAPPKGPVRRWRHDTIYTKRHFVTTLSTSKLRQLKFSIVKKV